MTKGRVHIYTGDGKGKTTTAIGLSVRAKSRGLRTLFVQFFKERDSESEISILNAAGIRTIVFDRVKSPLFNPEIDKAQIRREAKKAITRLKKIFTEEEPDLVVLDEFICLIAEGVIREEEALEFIRNRPEKIEIVLTGKGATEKMLEMADYATIMQKVRHPYERRMKARRGIEF